MGGETGVSPYGQNFSPKTCRSAFALAVSSQPVKMVETEPLFQPRPRPLPQREGRRDVFWDITVYAVAPLPLGEGPGAGLKERFSFY